MKNTRLGFDEDDVDTAEQIVGILEQNFIKRNWDEICFQISEYVLAFQEIRNAMNKTLRKQFEEIIKKINKVFENERKVIAKKYGDGFADKLKRALRDILMYLNK